MEYKSTFLRVQLPRPITPVNKQLHTREELREKNETKFNNRTGRRLQDEQLRGPKPLPTRERSRLTPNAASTAHPQGRLTSNI